MGQDEILTIFHFRFKECTCMFIKGQILLQSKNKKSPDTKGSELELKWIEKILFLVMSGLSQMVFSSFLFQLRKSLR